MQPKSPSSDLVQVEGAPRGNSLSIVVPCYNGQEVLPETI
jgi:hypothetical protein